MILADGLALYLVARRMGQSETPRAVVRRLLWFTLAVCSLMPMAICRFDLAIMAWTFAAAVAWGSGHSVLGGFLAGTGTLTKIVPGVAVLPSFIRELMSPGRRWGVVTCIGSVVACSVLWLVIGGSNVANSFGYHIERGVEIGSLYSGILLVGAVFLGYPVETTYQHNCLEIVSPWSETIGAFGFPLQATALAILAWKAYRDRGGDMLRYSAAAVLAFVIFGKVLSPQYLLWLIPFFACFPGKSGAELRRLYFIACVTTTLIFPWGWHWLLQFRNWAIGLLVYRNLLLLKLWYDLTFCQSFSTTTVAETRAEPAPGQTLHAARTTRAEANLAR
jgi:hypothetical protein